MTDKEIRVHVRNGLIEEADFRALEIRELENGEWHLTRGAPEKTLGPIGTTKTHDAGLLRTCQGRGGRNQLGHPRFAIEIDQNVLKLMGLVPRSQIQSRRLYRHMLCHLTNVPGLILPLRMARVISGLALAPIDLPQGGEPRN